MIRLLDGPAEAITLTLRRAPRLLRVTRMVSAHGVQFDALDMAGDEPDPAEDLFVYERVGNATQVHLKLARPKRSGWYMVAAYKLHAEQPADAILRDRENWLAWCLSQPEAKP